MGVLESFFYKTQLEKPDLIWELYRRDNATSSYISVLKGVYLADSVSGSFTHSYRSIQDRMLDRSGVMKTASDKMKDWSVYGSNKKEGRSFVEYVLDGVTQVADYLESMTGTEGLKEGEFITAIDYLQLFNGTTSDYSLPTLKTVLMRDLPGKGTPMDQFNQLLDVFVGNDPTDAHLSYGGIQSPPNDYYAKVGDYFTGSEDPDDTAGRVWDYDRTDGINNGTFLLRLANAYTIDDLIIKNFNYNFSTELLHGTDSPLLIEVDISLDHAFYVGKNRIKKFLTKSEFNAS